MKRPYSRVGGVLSGVLGLALLVAAAVFAGIGWGWLALDYLTLAVLVVSQYASVRYARRTSTEFGYRMGYRAARFEFWQSFHEGVIRRGLQPHEWLVAESERDDPRIAVIVPADGSDL